MMDRMTADDRDHWRTYFRCKRLRTEAEDCAKRKAGPPPHKDPRVAKWLNDIWLETVNQ